MMARLFYWICSVALKSPQEVDSWNFNFCETSRKTLPSHLLGNFNFQHQPAAALFQPMRNLLSKHRRTVTNLPSSLICRQQTKIGATILVLNITFNYPMAILDDSTLIF